MHVGFDPLSQSWERAGEPSFSEAQCDDRRNAKPPAQGRRFSVEIEVSGAGGFGGDWFGEPAIFRDPVFGGDGRQRWNGGEQRDEGDVEFPAEGDGGGDSGDGIGDERDPVDRSKERDAALGGVGGVLEDHADQEAGPGDGFDPGEDDPDAPDGADVLGKEFLHAMRSLDLCSFRQFGTVAVCR